MASHKRSLNLVRVLSGGVRVLSGVGGTRLCRPPPPPPPPLPNHFKASKFMLKLSVEVLAIYKYRIAGNFRGAHISRISRMGSNSRTLKSPKLISSLKSGCGLLRARMSLLRYLKKGSGSVLPSPDLCLDTCHHHL